MLLILTHNLEYPNKCIAETRLIPVVRQFIGRNKELSSKRKAMSGKSGKSLGASTFKLLQKKYARHVTPKLNNKAHEVLQKLGLQSDGPAEFEFADSFDGRPFIESSTISSFEEAKGNRITDSTKAPYNYICAIVSFYTDPTTQALKKRLGTGVLFGTNCILTAGYNIYSHEFKRKAKDIVVYPAINSTICIIPNCRVVSYHCPEEYMKGDYEEDYGIIMVNSPIGKDGFMPLKVLSSTELESREVHTAGYPTEKLKETREYQMWEIGGTIKEVEGKSFTYFHGNEGGQSGSPVWTAYEGHKVAIGSIFPQQRIRQYGLHQSAQPRSRAGQKLVQQSFCTISGSLIRKKYIPKTHFRKLQRNTVAKTNFTLTCGKKLCQRPAKPISHYKKQLEKHRRRPYRQQPKLYLQELRLQTYQGLNMRLRIMNHTSPQKQLRLKARKNISVLWYLMKKCSK
eukprot:TRINITY_DN617_c0_g1_i1.p1 TRINITY_DN617_c0_g1~~TRINITY_DN617_c0_g1_i1.p1  ORF type:complete len:488 (+),score=10.16 TRINITY_DN617_c0_g1_i1:102-1466(+)